MGCVRESLGLRAPPPPPQHYLCCSDVPVPRISVIFSLEELKDIEKDCAIYVGRMERVARHSSVSKEEKVRAPQPGLPGPSPPLPGGPGTRQPHPGQAVAPGQQGLRLLASVASLTPVLLRRVRCTETRALSVLCPREGLMQSPGTYRQQEAVGGADP